MVLNTSGGAVFTGPNYTRWYDFNGNGVVDLPYILQGHECLVFFLGGVPMQTSLGFGMTGFGKDPTNPFTNGISLLSNGNPNPMFSNNRQAPFFEFANSRLALDPSNPYAAPLPTMPQIPGYLDSLGNTLGGGQINFYAYFSSYGNGGYDPNDVNFTETDAFQNGPIGLTFHVTFPVLVSGTTTNISVSPAPNPYASSLRPLQRHDSPGHDLLESADVSDHLVGGRWAVWRGRAVHSQHHGGGPADGPELEQLSPVAARGQLHPNPRARQRHQYAQRQAGMTIRAFRRGG